jgi:hypothetical protein
VRRVFGGQHVRYIGKCARAVGLEGKLTATGAGEALVGEMKAWHATLGAYPHATLNPADRPTKKQTTRMVKCECDACGYIARTSAKWINDVGAPLCPCNKKPMGFEAPADEEEDSDE